MNKIGTERPKTCAQSDRSGPIISRVLRFGALARVPNGHRIGATDQATPLQAHARLLPEGGTCTADSSSAGAASGHVAQEASAQHASR